VTHFNEDDYWNPRPTGTIRQVKANRLGDFLSGVLVGALGYWAYLFILAPHLAPR